MRPTAPRPSHACANAPDADGTPGPHHRAPPGKGHTHACGKKRPHCPRRTTATKYARFPRATTDTCSARPQHTCVRTLPAPGREPAPKGGPESGPKKGSQNMSTDSWGTRTVTQNWARHTDPRKTPSGKPGHRHPHARTAPGETRPTPQPNTATPRNTTITIACTRTGQHIHATMHVRARRGPPTKQAKRQPPTPAPRHRVRLRSADPPTSASRTDGRATHVSLRCMEATSKNGDPSLVDARTPKSQVDIRDCAYRLLGRTETQEYTLLNTTLRTTMRDNCPDSRDCRLAGTGKVPPATTLNPCRWRRKAPPPGSAHHWSSETMSKPSTVARCPRMA